MARNGFNQPLAGFDIDQAIDLIVFFAEKSGGRISKLKLIKLIYLTEREFIKAYGFPSLFDEYYSLKHGPICSSTLNLVNGQMPGVETSDLFRLSGNVISLVRKTEQYEYDGLSLANLEAAQSVWSLHGNKTPSQIRAYTHKFCPEYTDVENGRVPIDIRDMLRFSGVEDWEEVAVEYHSQRQISAQYS